MNTDKRDERVEQIRQRHLRTDCYKSQMRADIDFLLSLLDSQAARNTSSLLRRLKDFLFGNCNHAERDRNYDWCPSCVMAFMEVVAIPSNGDTATQTVNEKLTDSEWSVVADGDRYIVAEGPQQRILAFVPEAQARQLAKRHNAALTAVRKEARAAAFREALAAIAVLPMQGTMNFRRGYEEGVRDALRTLEAAAHSTPKDTEP